MHCTVFIEDFLLPQAEKSARDAELRLPALETLFARATPTSRPPFEPAEWLCRSFGIAKQQDWPTAPLLARDDGITPGQHYWLHADPIYVQANRSQLVLAQTVADLSTEEAQALVATLNQHFAEDGLRFHAAHPNLWYLQVEQTPHLITTPLAQAMQRSVDPQLPRGDDALLWHRRINETQMILHTHEVNAARETRGVHPVNSVWPWGGGVMPDIGKRPHDTLWALPAHPSSGEQRLAQALAHACGIESPLPPTPFTLTVDGTHEEPLLMLKTLPQAGDVEAWRTQLTALDRDWLAPLLTALTKRQIERITLIMNNDVQALELDITSSQARRWWRRARPLDHFATQ